MLTFVLTNLLVIILLVTWIFPLLFNEKIRTSEYEREKTHTHSENKTL